MEAFWKRAGEQGMPMDEFTYEKAKDRVRVLWLGRAVMVLSGEKAKAFLNRVEEASLEDAQRYMAKVTGNFKRGNERLAGRHPRNKG